jgi:sulfide:quinone oxidoreductase
MPDHHEILIIGGGTGGLTVAAQLRNLPDPPEVAILEPSSKHYYQPLWTLVGGGVFPREDSERNEADFIPAGATWIQDGAAELDPLNKIVTTTSGRDLSYDFLVVAPGLQLDFGAIPGLVEGLRQPGSRVVTNYGYDTVEHTWDAIRTFKGGTALFTEPITPVKCGGAPQKIMYLAEEAFRKNGVRNSSKVIFVNAKASIFSSPYYGEALEKICAERGIEVRLGHELVALRPASKEAIIRDTKAQQDNVMRYDMIHVTPPMSSPDFVKRSPLANKDGWVDVDRNTLQHVRWPEVFSLGDASSLPTSKTGAAIRKQAPVLVQNLLAVRAGHPLPARYDGYTSCPLVTGYGKLILAEFDYTKGPTESFPFDQSKERYSMYALKAYALPRMYWHGMLRGRM